MKNTQVSGHALQHEGAAYVRERPGSRTFVRRYPNGGVGGEGHAMCSCGWRSALLTSGNQRKKAHREHKEAWA